MLIRKNVIMMKAFLLVFSCLFICLWSVQVYAQSANIFPKKDWAIDTPENHGLSSIELKEAAHRIKWISLRYCLVVIKDGYLVYERYYFGDKDSSHRAFSVTKALASALIGVAVTKNLLNLDDRVSYYFEPPQSMNPQATIKHVLSQVSQGARLGSTFKYKSNEIVDSLAKIVTITAKKKGLAENAEDFANKYLLGPTGMDSGIQWRSENKVLPFGKGSCGTCRAYARLGWLLLNKGNWDGEQLIDPAYVIEATTPQFPEVNAGYGYFLWLNNDFGQWVRPFLQGKGKMIDRAPASMVMATGFLGQIIFVLPESNMVIVSMGVTPRLETLKTARKFWNIIGPVVTD